MEKKINDCNGNTPHEEDSPHTEGRMSMDAFQEIRSKIVEGTANEEEDELFEAHLALLFEQDVHDSIKLSRSELRERESMYKAFQARIRNATSLADAPPSTRITITQDLRRALTKIFMNVQWKHTMIAATLCVAAIVALFWMFNLYQDLAQPTLITFAPANKSPNAKVLPDSSIATLSEGSTICYASDFEKNRMISLQGEANFKVTKDATKPFQVKSGKLSVTVTGTTFQVKSFPNAEYDTVAVTEGSVRVSNEVHEMTVLAGQRLIFDKKNKLFMLDIFIPRNATLEETAQKFSKNFNVKFEWEKPCLKYVPVETTVGYLHITSLDQAMHILTRAAGANFHRRDNIIIVGDGWNACRYNIH
jgi:hypothetical protein